MLFIIHFELDPSHDPSDILKMYQKVQEAEIAVEKWETKGWYITPEYWGIAIVETESVEDILTNANAWRIALPGIFKNYNISPAADVAEYAPNLAKLVRKLK